MLRNCWCSFFSLTAALCLAAAPVNAQVVVNGTFDTVVPTPGSGATQTGGGWTAFSIDAAGGHRLVGGNPGAFYILNDAGQAGTDPTLSQSISGFSVGTSYTVTGNYRLAFPGGSTTVDSFGVAINNVVLFGAPTPLLVTGGADTATWRNFSFNFVAANATNTLSLLGERNGTDNGYAVDNIAVTPANITTAPEPGALLLLGAVALPAAAVLRRRRLV